MSQRNSSGMLAALVALTLSPAAFAQDPIPVGYSGYPQGYGPPPYWAMPNPPYPYAMPQHQPQQPVAQASHQTQEGIITAALRGTHKHKGAQALPVQSTPYHDANCQGPSCHDSKCRKAFCMPWCWSHDGPKAALFDGSHLKQCFGIAHRPGPTAIDSVPFHPYARGPRDYFMFYENLEAERSRDLRPALIP